MDITYHKNEWFVWRRKVETIEWSWSDMLEEINWAKFLFQLQISTLCHPQFLAAGPPGLSESWLQLPSATWPGSSGWGRQSSSWVASGLYCSFLPGYQTSTPILSEPQSLFLPPNQKPPIRIGFLLWRVSWSLENSGLIWTSPDHGMTSLSWTLDRPHSLVASVSFGEAGLSSYQDQLDPFTFSPGVPHVIYSVLIR